MANSFDCSRKKYKKQTRNEKAAYPNFQSPIKLY